MADEAGGTGAGGDGTGGAPAPWFDADQATYVAEKGWKGPQDAVRTAINAEKLIGAHQAGRTFVLPKDDKDVDGIKLFRSKIGVPDAPEGYGIPESLKDDPVWPLATKLAHELGLPKTAFVGFTEKLLAQVVEQNKAAELRAQGESQTALTGLKTEWGDKFAERAEFAKRFVRAIGWDEKKIDLFERTFGTASMLKDFYAFGVKTAEHGFSGGDTDGSAAGGNLAIQRQIDDLRQKRIEGKMTEADYLQQVQALGARLQAAA